MKQSYWGKATGHEAGLKYIPRDFSQFLPREICSFFNIELRREFLETLIF